MRLSNTEMMDLMQRKAAGSMTSTEEALLDDLLSVLDERDRWRLATKTFVQYDKTCMKIFTDLSIMAREYEGTLAGHKLRREIGPLVSKALGARSYAAAILEGGRIDPTYLERRAKELGAETIETVERTKQPASPPAIIGGSSWRRKGGHRS